MITNDTVGKMDWHYLAEGNSSIVYSHDETKVVLRVRKHYQTENVDGYNKDVRKSPLENNKIYTEKILKFLVDNEEYFISVDVVMLSEKDRERLKELALSTKSRSEERKLRSFVLDSSAMLMPHLGFYESVNLATHSLHSFAVEIKPKWGFLPKMANLLSGEDVASDTTVCRFCIHQRLKIQNGKISSISPYCPLDLFASCSCRLKRALWSLFQEPQNNLRVFHNGNVIYSGLEVNSIKQNTTSFNSYLNDISYKSKETVLTNDAFISIICSIFVHDSWQGVESQSSLMNCTATSTPICKTKENVPLKRNDCFPLGPKGILKKLIRLQQICGIDASTVKSIIEIIKGRKEPSINLERIEDYTSQQWDNFVARIKEGRRLEDKGSVEDLIYNVQSFLVSATFKDCSIMITFTEKLDSEGHENNIVKDCNSSANYVYSIKLIDLDPKQIRKIDYYEQLDHDILKVYREHFKDDM